MFTADQLILQKRKLDSIKNAYCVVPSPSTSLHFLKKISEVFPHFFQIIPRIMPALLGDARIKEKFQDQEYLDTVEHMFREKFIENLSVSQKAFTR